MQEHLACVEHEQLMALTSSDFNKGFHKELVSFMKWHQLRELTIEGKAKIIGKLPQGGYPAVGDCFFQGFMGGICVLSGVANLQA